MRRFFPYFTCKKEEQKTSVCFLLFPDYFPLFTFSR
ncbi:hypothetical protein CLOBOL_07052 [Enterocloster bolteae ATCC BAA-613]|uniref:Uncharacterized protein n=1 Tax=Enterocloster bolteae (strain ATCC BAA-613 / DSM 15670 / CCUG 46953 / JCM 12243 / WAL 16351) TaxID=411902 RepID=A8S4R3_ENTBW|nr:hypothetical protein CLOBOL_07052 [Enterocloster bolteae ATCC BAA-613]